jgi:hypothetical protein
VLVPVAVLAVGLVAPVGINTAAAQTVSPRDGAELHYIHVPFTWLPDVSAVEYQLQIVKDHGDASPFATSSPVVNHLTGSDEARTTVLSGLEFGQSYAWRVRGISDAGPLAWRAMERFSTLPLPDGPKITVTRGPSPRAPEPGLTMFVQGTAWAVDVSGAVVWFLPEAGGDLRLLKNGNISYFGAGRGFERTLDGGTVWMSPDDPALYMHHELFPMPNGNYLTVVREFRDVERAGTIERWLGDAVVEIDPCTNDVRWSWSAFDHFSTDDFDADEMGAR